MYLFLDFETTGFPNGQLDPRHKDQARIVQVGLILTDPQLFPVYQWERLVQIEDGEMHEGAERIHGISKQFANVHGKPPRQVFEALSHLINGYGASHLIGHNLKFELAMLDLLAKQVGGEFTLSTLTPHCTMEIGTPFCGLLKNNGQPKPPKLMELFHKCFPGRPNPFFHSALADARTAMECYGKLIAEGLVK